MFKQRRGKLDKKSDTGKETNRKEFIQKMALLGGFGFVSGASAPEESFDDWPVENGILSIGNAGVEQHFSPLDTVQLHTKEAGNIVVLDNLGRSYVEKDLTDQISFRVGGALGNQMIVLEDNEGNIRDMLPFYVEAETKIEDEEGTYSDLLDMLYWSMVGNWGEADVKPYNGEFYHFFVRWLRDHVHTMKGMKYFYPNLKSGIDLYANSQREDGMIWDNYTPREEKKNWWDVRFSYGNFIRPVDNYNYEFKRIPVENDVEYLFLEGLYYTWKATGDDDWMAKNLDKALKAVEYSTTDPCRWSEKYKLLKRGFTIDTWDFQAEEDAEIAGGDIMVIKKDKTRFGVMFGDNTGMAAGCGYLAEMLEHTGRKSEAKKIRTLGAKLQQRINELSWTGEYYLHHVPENPQVNRDLGVDQSEQVSLSNAYSLNRGLTHEQCVAIIKTYQRIKQEMPDSSPGEWYTIYPPFEKGFDDHAPKWEYMNGGVISIVAGELAHGAFEHGFETYGADILRRVNRLGNKTKNYLHCTYKGKKPNPPNRTFEPVDLQPIANTTFPGREATHQGRWIGAGRNEKGIKNFHDIPFLIPDPKEYSNTGLELIEHTTNQLSLTLKKKAASIYFLQTVHQLSLAGSIILEYQDGTSHTEYINEKKAGNWWHQNSKAKRKQKKICDKAWRSDNDHYIGVYLFGLDNPYPEKTIETLRFERAKTDVSWYIAGITLSDAPVYFDPGIQSFGIPDNWGAAAVVYALIEGLAGIKDTGVAFDEALLAPRWESAGVKHVKATAKYESSGGYLSYKYSIHRDKKNIDLIFTGNAKKITVKILLPANKQASSATVNGKNMNISHERIEDSQYATFAVKGPNVFHAKLKLI